MGLTRPVSVATHYTDEASKWEPERRFRGGMEGKIDTMGSSGQYKPPVSLNLTGGDTAKSAHGHWVPPKPISEYDDTYNRDYVDLEVAPLPTAYSAVSEGQRLSPLPPTPLPSSPLPQVPGAVLRKKFEDRKNFPKDPTVSSESSSAAKPPEVTLYGVRRKKSDWSLERQGGSQPALSRQNSDGSEVKRSQFDRVTGFEYLGLDQCKTGVEKSI